MRRRYANLQGPDGACSPAMLIKHSPQTEITRDRNGDTGDIMHWIIWMDAHSADWIVTENVDCLRGRTDYDTLHNVWRFVKKNLRYKADRPGHERVKSPGALYTSREGDCKSFSIAEGALLKSLGIPYKYRFAAYEPGDFTHVYVVVNLDGQEVILDAVNDKGRFGGFDHEVGYYKKKDVRPASKIAGIGAGSKWDKMHPATGNAWGKYIAIGFFMYLILK